MSEQSPEHSDETEMIAPAGMALPSGPLAPVVSVSDEEKTLAAAALRKMQAGEEPSAREQKAVARLRKHEDETRLWRLLRAIPFKMWDAMTGRPRQIRTQQAQAYNLPTIGVEAVDLAAYLRAVDAFLTTNAGMLRAAKRDGTGSLGWQVKEIDLRLKKIELAKREGELVEVDRVHRMFMAISQAVHRMIENKAQKFGRESIVTDLEEVELMGRMWMEEFGAQKS